MDKSLLDAVDAGAVVFLEKFPYGWIFFRGKITCWLTPFFATLLLNSRMHLQNMITADAFSLSYRITGGVRAELHRRPSAVAFTNSAWCANRWRN